MYHNISPLDSLMNEALRDLNRLAIGFEPTLRRLQVTQGLSNQNGYPPYNIEKLDDSHHRITLAVAGFTMDDLDVTVTDDQLTITGEIKSRDDESKVYIHKGIAGRSFARTFILADHVHVTSASLENGMLTVDLVHEIPEALKPRKVLINDKSYIESKPLSVDKK